MDLILAATCIIVWGMMLFLSFLGLRTLRLVRELREDLGNIRLRLKQADSRGFWRAGRTELRRGHKATDFRWRKARGRRLL
jgi:hypothetical protein